MAENVFKLVGDKFIISEGYGSIKNKVAEARKIDKLYQAGKLSQAAYDKFKDYEKKQTVSGSMTSGSSPQINNSGSAPSQQTGSQPQVNQNSSQPNTQQQTAKTAPEGTIAKKIINAGYKDPTIILDKIRQWGSSNGITFDDNKLGKVSDVAVNNQVTGSSQPQVT